jgi:hypothetical protein
MPTTPTGTRHTRSARRSPGARRTAIAAPSGSVPAGGHWLSTPTGCMTAMLVLRPKQRIQFLVMAGLGPAIHVFAADRSGRCECVDARHKAGHDELAGRCIIRMSQNTREVAGFAYRMLYIDPMLVRSALGVCAITPFVPYAVAEDPALAAVLAEAFETFPGARSACPPGSRRRAVGRAVIARSASRVAQTTTLP